MIKPDRKSSLQQHRIPHHISCSLPSHATVNVEFGGDTEKTTPTNWVHYPFKPDHSNCTGTPQSSHPKIINYLGTPSHPKSIHHCRRKYPIPILIRSTVLRSRPGVALATAIAALATAAGNSDFGFPVNVQASG